MPSMMGETMAMDSTGSPRTITSIIGVYNADGTLRGELTYLVGHYRGTAHCALCDITHGRVRAKSAWKECRDALPVLFETFHRNDHPDSIRHLTEGQLPIVIALTNDGPVVLLNAADLERCNGSPEQLIAAMNEAVNRKGLRLQ